MHPENFSQIVCNILYYPANKPTDNLREIHKSRGYHVTSSVEMIMRRLGFPWNSYAAFRAIMTMITKLCNWQASVSHTSATYEVIFVSEIAVLPWRCDTPNIELFGCLSRRSVTEPGVRHRRPRTTTTTEHRQIYITSLPPGDQLQRRAYAFPVQ